MDRKGIQIIISGFSGSGKGTVVKKLLEQYPNYVLSISATTRKPREGEKEGREYFFKTEEEFKSMIQEEKLIEYAQYVGNYYGTPREYVEQQMLNGKDVILEIELQGALHIKKSFPETVLIFIMPPTADELKRRLTDRGTEEKSVIASRLARAYEEADGMEEYDYIIINDDLQSCVDQIHQIIRCEHERSFRNQDIIANIKQQLKVFSKGE